MGCLQGEYASSVVHGSSHDCSTWEFECATPCPGSTFTSCNGCPDGFKASEPVNDPATCGTLDPARSSRVTCSPK
jgi:hypothetical protein